MSRRSSSSSSDHDDHGEVTYRRSGRQRVILSLGVFAVMGCLAAVAFIGYQGWKLDQIEREDVNLVSATEDQAQNWLIVGSDSRDVIAKDDPNAAVFHGAGEPGGERSDTIMIVRFDPKANTLDILSLQRDLWLDIARTGGKERINTAYSFDDGPQRLIDTIKTNFGIDINHYAEINFASFEGIVEAVGGVPMYFDHPLMDDNSGLVIQDTGCQTLNGQQALAFARSRHLRYSDGVKWIDDPSGDLGRISRQQYFMRKMFDTAAKKAFSDPLVTNDLISVAQKYVKLDDDSEITKVVAMGQRMGQFEGDSIKSWTLPTTPFTTEGRAAVLRLDQAGAQPVLDRFRGIVPPAEAAAAVGDLDPAGVSFSVENGSGVKGQAAEAQKAFQALGYDVPAARDHGSNVARTEVRYAKGSLQAADQIERHLSSGAELVADASYPAGKVVLVTGTDFTTISRSARERTIEIPASEAGSTTATSAPSTSGSSTSGSSGSSGSSSSGSGTTATTVDPDITPTNDGTETVGVVPGQPPEGVVCE